MPALVGYLLLFLVVGIGFILVHLLAGKVIRPARPDTEKLTIYECGEPTIGTAWIQFDLRFYVVALLFVIFDVEVAFFFPWAVVFGKANTLAGTRLPDEERAVLSAQLTPDLDQPGQARADAPSIEPEAASRLAWLAFWDILVFFGVLLVGFAYLWRRGDLNWVRSTAAERIAAREEGLPSPQAAAEELVGAGERP